ncbi:EpsG family protein [Staphylococcus equorum]
MLLYFLFCFNLLFKILTKNLSESTDYITYLSAFNKLENLSFYNMLKSDIFEWLFRFMAWFTTQIFPNSVFLLFVLLINLILVISFYRFYENKILSIFSILIYTYSPLFFSMSTNILRQMLVISLILLVLTLYKEKKVINLIFPMIHLSSIVIVIFIYIHNFIKTKYFIYFTLICIILFITNINSMIFSSLSIVSDYTDQQSFTNYGGQPNRLDFLIFTLFIVLLSAILYKAKCLSIIWFKYSLFSASYYFMFGFQAFSERYAIYNWIMLIFLAPLVLQLLKRRIYYR